MAANYGTTLAATHLDQATDDPSQARNQLKLLLDEVNSILGDRGAAGGLCDLDSTGKVPGTRLVDVIDNSQLKTNSISEAKIQDGAISFNKFKATVTSDTATPSGGTDGDMWFIYLT